MSLTITIIGGNKNYTSAMPGPIVSGLVSLDKKGFVEDVRLLAGQSDTPFGEPRTALRQDLLRAIERLMPPAQSMGSGFRVWAKFYPGDPSHPSGGVSGLLIEGTYFGIVCSDDYWVLRPSGGSQGKNFSTEMMGRHRYEPAEIQTENMGIVKIERKKGKRAELVELLTEMQEFLESIPDETVTVIVG